MFSSEIFQIRFYPKFFLPRHDLEEPEEVVLFGLVQLGQQGHQLPQMEVYRLRLLLVQGRQDTEQHRVPWEESKGEVGESVYVSAPQAGSTLENQHTPGDTSF